ncbi:hypothetical protein BDM02DRAFT_3270011 [Thelephora ganbajun]|uniref:Uncharacterized protein n=1 Tax=Thelephora ganbajun TaxID=370292 RepID=A0ACB6ZDB8_THEGA|nr:hypothetical protein BDM02DRAFT_3270011 [Thelephora ganbajun]
MAPSNSYSLPPVDTEDGTQGAGVATPTASGKPTRDSVFSKVGIIVWIPVASVVTPKGYRLHSGFIPLQDSHLGTKTIGRGYPQPPLTSRHSNTRNIHVQSLRAELVFLQTINKSVEDVMEAWSSIHVETSNAGLDVNVMLTPAPALLHARHTELFLKTSNGLLKSSVTLHADPTNARPKRI